MSISTKHPLSQDYSAAWDQAVERMAVKDARDMGIEVDDEAMFNAKRDAGTDYRFRQAAIHAEYGAFHDAIFILKNLP